MKFNFSFKTIATLALAMSTLVAIGQNSTENNMKMRISAVNLDFGGNAVFSVLTNSDYLDLRNSAIDQQLFISNPEDFTLEEYSGLGGSFAPSISLGLTPFSKKLGKLNYNRELRLRLGGSFGARRSFYYTQEHRTPYDTLTSSQGNGNVFIDSVYYNNPSYVETIFEMNIGASYLFKTEVTRRWHFYAGFGGEYGFAIQNFVSVYQDEGVYYADENDSDDQKYYRSDNQNDDGDFLKSKISSNSHFIRLYVPVGVNFRIANKSEFWRHVNLYTQMNPGLEFQIAPDAGTFTNPFFGIALLGIRYTID